MTETMKNRLFVGAGLLFLWVGAVYAGSFVFRLFVMGMIILAAFEWGKLAGLSQRACFVYAGAIAILSLTWFGMSPYMSYVVLVSVGLMLWRHRWAVLAGIVVLPYVFSTILLLIAVSENVYGVWWLAVVYVWAAVIIMDSAAYVVGKRFGKNLLSPRISPGKTWEGFIGGLVLTMMASAIFYLVVAEKFALSHMHLWIVGTGGIACFAQLGDLCESQMKRHAGVKDSGGILREHGGVLDRIDGLIGALIVTRILWELL